MVQMNESSAMSAGVVAKVALGAAILVIVVAAVAYIIRSRALEPATEGIMDEAEKAQILSQLSQGAPPSLSDSEKLKLLESLR